MVRRKGKREIVGGGEVTPCTNPDNLILKLNSILNWTPIVEVGTTVTFYTRVIANYDD